MFEKITGAAIKVIIIIFILLYQDLKVFKYIIKRQHPIQQKNTFFIVPLES